MSRYDVFLMIHHGPWLINAQSASAVLAATMSPQIHPNGFRVSDRPVAASFAHPYSFQPVTDFLSRDEACVPSSLSLGGAEGTWVRYWDESATVAVLEFEVDEPAHSASTTEKDKDKEKEKKKRVKSKNQLIQLLADYLSQSKVLQRRGLLHHRLFLSRTNLLP